MAVRNDLPIPTVSKQHCFDFVPEPEIGRVSKKFCKGFDVFKVIEGHYRANKILKPIIDRAHANVPVFTHLGFVKRVYERVIADAKEFSGGEEVLKRTREKHHSKVASLRLQEVAEWTEANAQAINIIFETAAQEHPAAQDFLQHLNDGQNLTLVERASQIRDWMYQNRGALATVEDLDLCRLSLTYLPPEIGLFQGLRTLNLSHNQLTELPAQIGNLRMLVILCLNNNQLRERPRGFENRSQLMIYLKGNPFIRNRGTKRRQETEK